MKLIALLSVFFIATQKIFLPDGELLAQHFFNLRDDGERITFYSSESKKEYLRKLNVASSIVKSTLGFDKNYIGWYYSTVDEDGDRKIQFAEMESPEKKYTQDIYFEIKRISHIAKQKGDVKKQLEYINNYLVYNTKYTNKDIRSSFVDEKLWTAYSTLIEKETVCEGYANTVTLLCEELDIPVIEVYSKDLDHIWNKVYIDGKWLNIDVTRNNPVWNETPSISDINKRKTKFFLKTDEEMKKMGIDRNEEIEKITKKIKYPQLFN